MSKTLGFLTSDETFKKDAGLLVIRLFFGGALAFAHGLGKLPVSEGFVNAIGEMGLPMPAFFAWAAALAEFVGGLMLVAGLMARPAAFFVLVTMLVAGLVVHASDPFRVKELAFAYGVVALAVLIGGAGRYSLDTLLFDGTGKR